VAGNRWKVEPQRRYTPVDADAAYYWTSVFYYENLSSDPFHGPYYNAIVDATLAGSLDTVPMVSVRITNVTAATEYGIVTVGPPYGEIPTLDGGLFNDVARIVGWSEGRQVSYKLWRFPMRIVDLDGKELSTAAMGIINDGILTNLNSVTLCNVNGVPIDEWTCDGLIHMWQVRHGTKRRERVVYAYP